MGLVAITGANSASGLEILREGSDSFIACVRSERAEGQLPRGVRSARIAYDDPASMDRALSGCSAVVHLPGVLIEGPGSSYRDANVVPAESTIAAALRAGVQKFVLVSAVGADEHSRNAYYRSKGHAERLLRDSGLSYTIMRAPLVLGPATEGGLALQRNARGARARLLGGGQHLQQPLDLRDLANGARRAAEPEIAPKQVLEFVGPEAISERELVERAARELGHDVQIRSLPISWVRGALRLKGLFGGLGFSVDALDVITDDTTRDPEPARAALQVELTDLEETIRYSVAA
jgi:NADH dehydrogenase